ncbi:MAG: type VI secretion system ImpA family N-terminal domain-containing protein [Planctomycetaceae bacterium]|nr:hypothetical protein [Planctomycetota bacterium]NUO15623.1 type VI secretion system ImpA family N-terminal domain-containing protein [Planctomycetaceae bacterium]GIK52107.1 MAG: hypothetical protein BroJett014_10800 [Planctomycetota bacterium]HRJ77831.1 type VI secretion system ImpA family N-terminal domain-containing protein [Planctomycetota bacterium]
MPDEILDAALGTTPIAGALPSGENARYDPDYEALEAEVKKMESLTGETVAWPRVVELGKKLLAEKTKDLLVSGYLGMAMLQTQGYGGLASAITVTRDLLKTFWDSLFPELKRMRARVTALQWLNDRVANAINNRGQAVEQDREGLEKCAAAVKELGDVVGEKFTEERPDLGALSRAITDKMGQLAGAESAPQTGGDSMEGHTEQAAPAVTGGGGGAIRTRADAFRRLQEVANWLKRNDPHSPVAMLVQRAVAWGNLSLEQVLTELIRNSDVRDRVFEELGAKKQEPASE